MVLSSCVFSGSPKTLSEVDSKLEHNSDESFVLLGDSITVDTLIGDFKVFYRVRNIVNSPNQATNAISITTDNNENSLKVDKRILLNIQEKDSTSIVAYKTISIDDFYDVLPDAKECNFLIETFCLKEVTLNSLVFDVKLCKFDDDLFHKVDLIIDKKGAFKYILQE